MPRTQLTDLPEELTAEELTSLRGGALNTYSYSTSSYSSYSTVGWDPTESVKWDPTQSVKWDPTESTATFTVDSF